MAIRKALDIQRMWRGFVARRRFFVRPRLKIRPAQFDDMLVFPAPRPRRRAHGRSLDGVVPPAPPAPAEDMGSFAAEPKLALTNAAPPRPKADGQARRRPKEEQASVFTASTPESEEMRWLAAQKLAEAAVRGAFE